MADILQILIDLDKDILLFFNGLHNSFIDYTMLFFTLKQSWAIFYMVLIWVIFKKYSKKGFIILLGVAAVIALSDQCCNIAKYGFERARPAHDPIIGDLVYIFYKKGGPFGFFSAHAATTFGITAFIFKLLKNRVLHLNMLIWASLVAFSRVWLGLHYPGDIIVGGAVGYLIGDLSGRLLDIKYRFAPLENLYTKIILSALYGSIAVAILINLLYIKYGFI